MSGIQKQYKYTCDGFVSVGAFVIVDTPSWGYAVAEVMAYYKEPDVVAVKHIVSVVDDTEYRAAKNKVARRKEILKKMERIEQKVADEARLKFLASYSPEAADLLKELENL